MDVDPLHATTSFAVRLRSGGDTCHDRRYSASEKV